MNRISSLRLALCALLFSTVITNHTLGQSTAYTFTKVADSAADELDPFSVGAPALSDLGHVAFTALIADQTAQRALRSGPPRTQPSS